MRSVWLFRKYFAIPVKLCNVQFNQWRLARSPPNAIISTISKADPLATGFAAVRAGIVVFTIPFVFAFYPELLLIEQAQVAQSLDGSTAKAYLPGYDGTVSMGPLFWLLLKLVLSLYLVASALTKFDAEYLSMLEVVVRIGVAVLVLIKVPEISNVALGAGLLLLIFHQVRARIGRSSEIP